MKRVLVVLTALLALVAGANAGGFKLFGSYWDAGDLQEGYGGGAGVCLDIFSFLGLDLRGSYIVMDDTEVNVIPLEAALLLKIPIKAVIPYGGVGGGYYMYDADDFDIEDAVGAFAVAGLNLKGSSGLGLFGEVRWIMLEAEVDDLRSEIENLDKDSEADGVGVNVGLFWYW